MQQKIITHLWYDKEAKEAAEFYVAVFGNGSGIKNTTTISGTPSGDVDIVSFNLSGEEFMAISAGPLFKFNPSVSLMVNFDPSRDKEARARLDEAWTKLSEGGKVLMPINKYPFSERYGWIQDKYGLSWQLILSDPRGEERPFIVPALMFIGHNDGKAKEAIDFYCSVFKESKKGQTVLYPSGNPYGSEGNVMFADFRILDTWLAAMDSGHQHDFNFNEAISLIINCDTQEEINYLWEKLSAVPEAEQCGWLKDKYGLSWQIVPAAMNEMMAAKDKKKLDRITQAFLKMKKFDIAELKRAAEEK